jgi:hypothetical protein
MEVIGEKRRDHPPPLGILRTLIYGLFSQEMWLGD